MTPRAEQASVIGLLLLGLALFCQLVLLPYLQSAKDSQPTYWQTIQPLPSQLGAWRGEHIQFPKWMQSYLPDETVSAISYRHMSQTSYPPVEFMVVHSKNPQYLHNPKVCSDAQGYQEVALGTQILPQSYLRAETVLLRYHHQAFIQLRWYQWGQHLIASDFYRWTIARYLWRLRHLNAIQCPVWHAVTITVPLQDELSSHSQQQAIQMALLLAAEWMQYITVNSPTESRS